MKKFLFVVVLFALSGCGIATLPMTSPQIDNSIYIWRDNQFVKLTLSTSDYTQLQTELAKKANKTQAYVIGKLYSVDDEFYDPTTFFTYHVLKEYTSVDITDDIQNQNIRQMTYSGNMIFDHVPTLEEVSEFPIGTTFYVQDNPNEVTVYSISDIISTQGNNALIVGSDNKLYVSKVSELHLIKPMKITEIAMSLIF